jgi:hypothetical protein
MYIGSNIPPRNSHFHVVIRHSIAGISLMWRLATKRNGIIQNEIKPVLTKQFLGEIQDKN